MASSALLLLCTTALFAVDDEPIEFAPGVAPFAWVRPALHTSEQSGRLVDAFVKLAVGREASAIVVDPRWWTVIAGSMDFRRFKGLRCRNAEADEVILTLYGSDVSADVAFTFVGPELCSVRRVATVDQSRRGLTDEKQAELLRLRERLHRHMQKLLGESQPTRGAADAP